MSKENRKCLLERVDDTNVVQLYCDDFDNLDPKDKILAYHLSQAARAGRSITIDQASPFSRNLQKLLESMLTSPSSFPTEQHLNKIHEYLKKFWISQGPYNHGSRKKTLLDMAPDEFMKIALQFTSKADYWAKVLCDSAYLPSNCDKSANDIIAASSSNFYHGLTFQEVEEWARKDEKYPLNSSVAKTDQGIIEHIWRSGNIQVIPGLYAAELTRINGHLRAAADYASPAQRTAILSLVDFFETGDPKDFERFNIEWVGYDTTIDFILGFIETYLDPRGMKGSYEGIIHAVDTEATAIMAKLGHEAAYFESRMPWDDKYKNPNVKPLAFRVVNVISACGDAGPIMPIGVNLPNDNSIRERYGSKSVMLKNIMSTYRKTMGGKLLREFAWDEEEIALGEKWGDLDGDLQVAMHEVLGHASGKMARSEDPSKLLPGCYSTLEEARADLVALWLIFDPKLKELGLVPSDNVGRASYQNYVRSGGIMQLRRITEGDTIEESHAKNRQLIVRYIMDKSDAVSTRIRDSKTYFVVTNFEEMRKKVGELLAEIMRIKAEGDLPAAKTLIERYGTKIDTKLRDEVIRRTKALDAPNFTAFVMPELSLVHHNGSVDVELSYPLDLTKQMMTWE